MATLETYKSIAEKNRHFRTSGMVENNTIDNIRTFNEWYNRFAKRVKDRSLQPAKELFFFRGVADAKYKLYNSAQRLWISKELENWDRKTSYRLFLKKTIEEAKADYLFKRVFEFYDVSKSGQDFPILSILQHYGAPTPLMDWTLDIDVALYFAVDDIDHLDTANQIDHYFSVYIIDNEKSRIRSIASIADSEYRPLDVVLGMLNLKQVDTKNLFYLSDYETKALHGRTGKEKPLTTIYNQNIISQKGLFIFNPLPDVPLEKYFNMAVGENAPFRCFNIKKDMAEYIKRKIESKGIKQQLIYPDLKNNTKDILQKVLNSYFKKS